MTITPAELDSVMKAFEDGITKSPDIQAATGLDNDKYVTVLMILKHDGYVSYINFSETNMPQKPFITDAGTAFYHKGGYTEQKRKDELNEKQISSVITTNKSVLANNKLQRLLIVLATIFSGLSLFVSYLAYKKDSITNVNVPPPKVVILKQQDTSTLEKTYPNTLQRQ